MGGDPVIAYHHSISNDLMVVHCNDAACAGGDDTPITVDSAEDTGQNPSLDASGYPVIAYYDATNDALKLAVVVG